jgi:hypothetical protein
MQRQMASLPALRPKDRTAIITAFTAKKTRLLQRLKERAGTGVIDLRLCGSVLDPAQFRRGSDVDVAVITVPGDVALANFVLYVLAKPLVIRVRGIPLALHPTTVTEAEWPAWYKGKRTGGSNR